MHITPHLISLLRTWSPQLESGSRPDSGSRPAWASPGAEVKALILGKEGNLDLLAVGGTVIKARGEENLPRGALIKFRVIDGNAPIRVKLLSVLSPGDEHTRRLTKAFLNVQAGISRLGSTMGPLLELHGLQSGNTGIKDPATLLFVSLLKGLAQGEKPAPDNLAALAALIPSKGAEKAAPVQRLLGQALQNLIAPKQVGTAGSLPIDGAAAGGKATADRPLAAGPPSPPSTQPPLGSEAAAREPVRAAEHGAGQQSPQQAQGEAPRMGSDKGRPAQQPSVHESRRVFSPPPQTEASERQLGTVSTGLKALSQQIHALHQYQNLVQQRFELPFFIVPLWFQNGEGFGHWAWWQEESESPEQEADRITATHLVFDLHLGKLGPVKIHLTSVGKGLSIGLAARQRVLTLVRQGLQELRTILQGLGMRLEGLEVFSLEDLGPSDLMGQAAGILSQVGKSSLHMVV
jgi:hypothetical protein